MCSMDIQSIEGAANSIDGVRSSDPEKYIQALTLRCGVFKKAAADDSEYNKLRNCCQSRPVHFK